MRTKPAIWTVWVMMGIVFFGTWYHYQQQIYAPKWAAIGLIVFGAIAFIWSGLVIYFSKLEDFDGYDDE